MTNFSRYALVEVKSNLAFLPGNSYNTVFYKRLELIMLLFLAYAVWLLIYYLEQELNVLDVLRHLLFVGEPTEALDERQPQIEMFEYR